MASKDILVCGTLNLETTFSITTFPLDYEPVSYRPFEIRSQPSGVGFNIARALSTLGNRVRFVSMVGSDFLGTALRQSMAGFGLPDEFILPILEETPQSIVIFDGAGRRMVNTARGRTAAVVRVTWNCNLDNNRRAGGGVYVTPCGFQPTENRSCERYTGGSIKEMSLQAAN